jgi:hypothetical protein
VSIDRLAGVVLAASLVLTITLACGDGDGDGGGSTGPDPTGSIEVTLTVAGDAPDADGCVFTVDGASQRRILSGESTTYTGLSVGQHEVAISDVAGNCQVLGEAVRSISVAADQTATSTFAVTCAQGTGSIAVSVSTSGDNQDPDGYEVVVDGGAPAAIGINGSMTAAGLAAGDHAVALEGVAANCSVAGDNPRTVSVTAGQATQTAFSVSCTSAAGSIEVSVSTTGEDQDPDGYDVVIDGGAPSQIGVNGTTTAGGLTPGDHTVALEDVASNCSVSGGASRTVSVTADQTTAVSLDVTCASTTGSIRVSASTGGEDLDEDGYEIVVDGGAPSAIGINGSLTAGGLAPGDYSVELQGEAFNCSVGGNNPRTVTVTGGAETPVTFDVTCRYHLYNRIAFQSYRTGPPMLYAIDPYDLTSERPLGITGLHPAVSPDGLRIAYSHEDDIWIARSDGSGAGRITSSSENEYYPAWSSDGNWIAYERDGEIWTMREDGSNQVMIFDFGTQPTWSPDGTRVAFTDAGDIWILNADGSGLTGLTGNPTANQRPAWSPLGNYIGFASARDGSLHVFVQDPGGGPAINMTIALIGHATDPTWAPAAEAGAFSSEASGTSDIYYFVPGSAGIVRLTTNPADDVHPSWGGGN